MRAHNTLRPFETARQTSGFKPIKKPLLSPSICSLRKAKSIKPWTRNQYLIAVAHVGFSLLSLVDPHVAFFCVCVCNRVFLWVSVGALHAYGCTSRIDFSNAAKEKTKSNIKWQRISNHIISSNTKVSKSSHKARAQKSSYIKKSKKKKQFNPKTLPQQRFNPTRIHL